MPAENTTVCGTVIGICSVADELRTMITFNTLQFFNFKDWPDSSVDRPNFHFVFVQL